jgi:hypothetical protein
MYDAPPDNILIDAKTLKNISVQKKQVKREVDSILRNMDEEIKAAHKEGKKLIIYELPTVCTVDNMTPKEAMEAVHASIIASLRIKNYRVWMQKKDDCVYVKVTWMSEEDEKIFAERKAVLATVMKF